MGYPGLLMYLTIVGLSFAGCHRVRRQAARGEIPHELGRYAVGLEAALVAFVVGGSFVPVTEASTVRARAVVVVDAEEPVPSFAWGPTAATR